MKFKAKPIQIENEYEDTSWLDEKLDEDGYIHGYYVDGHIVGDFAVLDSEYTHLDYWVPVQKETLVPINGDTEDVPPFVRVLMRRYRKEEPLLTFYGFITHLSEKGFRDNNSKEAKAVRWLLNNNEEKLMKKWLEEKK